MKALFSFFVGFITVTSLYAQTTTLHIDPDNAFGGTTSQIFDSVKFIPLETTKESLFGRIYQLEITDKYFIIADFDTWAVLIFNKNGKFHAKIKKRSENEFFSSFTIDREGNKIILPITDDKVLVYDFDGKFISEHQSVADARRLFYFNPHSVGYHINRPLKWDKKGNEKYDLVYSNGFNQIIKKLLPYNPKYEQYEYNLPDIIFSDNDDGTCFFTFPYNYTVKQLSDTGIIHQYKFVFPQKYSLPANFATDSSYAGKRQNYVFSSQENTGKFTALTPFFKINNYLLFHLQEIQVVYGDNDNLFYDLKTGNTFLFNRITGDASSSFIPVLDSHFDEDLLGVYKSHIYTSISPVMLFNIKASSDKVIKYSPELENLFTKGSAKDNPVIIESKLKEGL